MKKAIGISIIIVVILLIGAEVGLRFAGFKPYAFKTHPWKSSPRYFIKSDSLLGFKLDTGVFQFTVGDKTSFATTIFPGERITSFNDSSASDDNRQRILFLGGYNVYGFGIKDEETFPFVFQSAHPELKVRNLAVPGYGVAADYVLVTQATEIKKGDVFVFMYFTDHDKRPSLKLQKGSYANVKTGYNKLFPTLALDENLRPYFNQYDYKLFPLSQYSALINFLEDMRNVYSDKRAPEHDITKKAMLALDQFCRERGATFVLVGRRSDALTTAMIDYCAKNGVHAVQFPLNDNSFNPEKNDKLAEKRAFGDKLMQYLVREKIVPSTTLSNYK